MFSLKLFYFYSRFGFNRLNSNSGYLLFFWTTFWPGRSFCTSLSGLIWIFYCTCTSSFWHIYIYIFLYKVWSLHYRVAYFFYIHINEGILILNWLLTKEKHCTADADDASSTHNILTFDYSLILLEAIKVNALYCPVGHSTDQPTLQSPSSPNILWYLFNLQRINQERSQMEMNFDCTCFNSSYFLLVFINFLV